MAQQLRSYQEGAVRGVFDAWKRGARSVLMVSPTGSGKTTIFSWIAAETKAPVMILVHRRELATQACNRLREFGVPFGLVMSGEKPNPLARVQVASVQTLVRRLETPLGKLLVERYARGGLVIPDEAHLSTADTWKTVLEAFNRCRVLGATATPWRLGGRPLRAAYDDLVVVAQPADLCEQGFLSPYVGFSYKAPDLSEVHTVGGEYNERESAAAMSAPGIVAGIVEEWQKHAAELSTIVFAVTVEHSRKIADEFVAVGVRAEHLDGATSVDQRRAILARLESGETQVLCNVGVAVEGLDVPRVKCIVLARPTQSTARAIQMMGRGRRPWGGLTCRIHDHAFVISQHGLPDDERDYTLDARPQKVTEKLRELTTCPDCFALYNGSNCPACHTPKPRGERQAPEVIQNAEQFEFASGQAGPERWIDVRWDTPGRVLEGIYRGSKLQQTAYGDKVIYRLSATKGRHYSFPGTSRLDRLMAGMREGQVIRVTYVEETALAGGRTLKQFRVEVDEPSEAAA